MTRLTILLIAAFVLLNDTLSAGDWSYCRRFAFDDATEDTGHGDRING